MSGYYTYKLKHPNAKKKKVTKEVYVDSVTHILDKQLEFKYLKESTRKTYLKTIVKFLKWFKKTP